MSCDHDFGKAHGLGRAKPTAILGQLAYRDVSLFAARRHDQVALDLYVRDLPQACLIVDPAAARRFAAAITQIADQILTGG